MSDVVSEFMRAKFSYEKDGGRDENTKFVCSREKWKALWRQLRESNYDRTIWPVEAPEETDTFLFLGSRLRIDDAIGDDVRLEANPAED